MDVGGPWIRTNQGVVGDDVMVIRLWIAFRYWTLVLTPMRESGLTSCSKPIHKWLPGRLYVPSSIPPELILARDRSRPKLMLSLH